MSYTNLDLKIIPKIDGCKTVDELSKKGCPICGRTLYPEASMGFGSLWCRDHSCIWQWCPSRYGKRKTTDLRAPAAWKNHVTGTTSKAWGRMFRV